MGVPGIGKRKPGRPRLDIPTKSVHIRLDKSELARLDSYCLPGEKRASAMRRLIATIPFTPEPEKPILAPASDLLDALQSATK